MAEPEILDVPPEEAIRHFKSKGYHAGFSWQDTDATEHLQSFTAAKAMRLDVLEALRGEVDRAIADGTTFEAFAHELQPKLVKLGWWGKQPVFDPETGLTQISQVGSMRRLRIIFDTNIRMSYARGRWDRIERVAEYAPWLRYVATRDERTRPQHMAWHGTVLPWDHPFWRSHYPPNGWRCRCTVMQLSEADLKEFGLRPSKAPPEGWDKARDWRNRRTGKTYQVPVGIDPGFQHNAGLLKPAAESANRLIAKIDRAEPALQRFGIGRPWNTALFARHMSGSSGADWPVAITDGPVARRLGAASSVVRFSSDSARKQARRHEDIGAGDYELVQYALDHGEWFEGRQNHHVQGFVRADGRWWKVVLKRTVDGGRVYLVTLHKVERRKLLSARSRYAAAIP